MALLRLDQSRSSSPATRPDHWLKAATGNVGRSVKLIDPLAALRCPHGGAAHIASPYAAQRSPPIETRLRFVSSLRLYPATAAKQLSPSTRTLLRPTKKKQHRWWGLPPNHYLFPHAYFSASPLASIPPFISQLLYSKLQEADNRA